MMPLTMRPVASAAQGFSLVETLVTLVIMGVLTMIAVPGMLDLYRDSRLSSQTDLLVGALNTARMEAVRRGGNGVAVCPLSSATECSSTTDWSGGFAVATCSNEKCTTLGTILQKVEMKSGTTVTSTSSSAVVFNGVIGSSTATATTTITVCATDRKQQQAQVNVSGHVSKVITTTVCS